MFVDEIKANLYSTREVLTQKQESLKMVIEESDESQHSKVKLKASLEKAQKDFKESGEKLAQI